MAMSQLYSFAEPVLNLYPPVEIAEARAMENLKTLLIANRGEISSRIIRTARFGCTFSPRRRRIFLTGIDH